jgi:hypothetical protein
LKLLLSRKNIVPFWLSTHRASTPSGGAAPDASIMATGNRLTKNPHTIDLRIFFTTIAKIYL